MSSAPGPWPPADPGWPSAAQDARRRPRPAQLKNQARPHWARSAEPEPEQEPRPATATGTEARLEAHAAPEAEPATQAPSPAEADQDPPSAAAVRSRPQAEAEPEARTGPARNFLRRPQATHAAPGERRDPPRGVGHRPFQHSASQAAAAGLENRTRTQPRTGPEAATGTSTGPERHTRREAGPRPDRRTAAGDGADPGTAADGGRGTGTAGPDGDGKGQRFTGEDRLCEEKPRKKPLSLPSLPPLEPKIPSLIHPKTHDKCQQELTKSRGIVQSTEHYVSALIQVFVRIWAKIPIGVPFHGTGAVAEQETCPKCGNFLGRKSEANKKSPEFSKKKSHKTPGHDVRSANKLSGPKVYYKPTGQTSRNPGNSAGPPDPGAAVDRSPYGCSGFVDGPSIWTAVVPAWPLRSAAACPPPDRSAVAPSGPASAAAKRFPPTSGTFHVKSPVEIPAEICRPPEIVLRGVEAFVGPGDGAEKISRRETAGEEHIQAAGDYRTGTKGRAEKKTGRRTAGEEHSGPAADGPTEGREIKRGLNKPPKRSRPAPPAGQPLVRDDAAGCLSDRAPQKKYRDQTAGEERCEGAAARRRVGLGPRLVELARKKYRRQTAGEGSLEGGPEER